MNKKIIIDLEKRLKEEASEFNVGDSTETTLLKTINEEDMSLENILISIYNILKIHECKIEKLQNSIDLLASRVYNTEDDFTEEEKEEIVSALNNIELEQLNDIYKFENCFVYENLDLREKFQKELINKIKYPTKKMADTFKKLVSSEIESRNKKTMSIEDILEIKTNEQVMEFAQLQSCFNKSQLIIIANSLKTASGSEINDPKKFLVIEINKNRNADNEDELNEILDKIKNLTEFQAYHLINMLSDLFE